MGNAANRPQVTLHSGDMYYKSHGASFSLQISAGDETINVPSYLYLREVGGDHAITSVYVPAYTRAKVVTIDSSMLEEETSYFITWATCSCPAATPIASSSACFVTSMRAYQRQLAAIAAQEEQDKRKREKDAADILAAERRRQMIEAGNGVYYFRISDEERSVLRRHFNEIDADYNGSVSKAELKTYYSRVIGKNLFDEEIDEMVRDSDTANFDGRIQFTEFIDICMAAASRKSSVKWEKVYDTLAAELAAAAQGGKRARRA